MVTIGALLAPAVRHLDAAGCPTPALDAQLWLAHVCRLTRSQLLAHPERIVGAEHNSRFQAGIDRLVAGEPLPYLTGEIEFYSLLFHVTQDTLIPRPETEHLVDIAQKLVANQPAELLVADVGTGSGCIAVALAVSLSDNRPETHCFATDSSAAALKVAARNAARHRVADRITFLHGHLLAPLPHPVHLIVANLPYVADHEWPALPVSVRDYEPTGALWGGSNGLELIAALLEQVPTALCPQGAVALEIGATQGPAALALALDRFPAARVQLEQDYSGRDRIIVIET